MQAWPWTQSPGERGPRIKLRRQVCVSRLEGLRLRVWAGAPWSCMGLWKASTWPREWGHACCPSHSPACVSCVPWLLLGIFQFPGLHPVPLPPAQDSDEPWPERLWGADSSVPRPEGQQWVWTAWDGSARLVLVRGAHGAADMCVVSPSGTVLPQGFQGLHATEAHCPVGWRVSLIILPPGPHRACPGAAPVCTEHSLGVGDGGAGWRLGPGNHTQGSAYTSSSGAQGRNRSLKSGK